MSSEVSTGGQWRSTPPSLNSHKFPLGCIAVRRRGRRKKKVLRICDSKGPVMSEQPPGWSINMKRTLCSKRRRSHFFFFYWYESEGSCSREPISIMEREQRRRCLSHYHTTRGDDNSVAPREHHARPRRRLTHRLVTGWWRREGHMTTVTSPQNLNTAAAASYSSFRHTTGKGSTQLHCGVHTAHPKPSK